MENIIDMRIIRCKKQDDGWIGVDFDRTLVTYHEWKGPDHIGKPIEKMVSRVKKWLKNGKEVKIFTARVSEEHGKEAEIARKAIEEWCEEIFGEKLEITNVKDGKMKELWDDRAIQVIKNTGERADGKD